MRRGAISVSANTVVLLLVALVLLLSLGAYVVSTVRGANDFVEREAKAIPEPPAPTASEPVRASAVRVSRGESFVMKVRARPIGTVELTPLLLCDQTIGGQQVNVVQEQRAEFRASQTGDIRWLLVGTVRNDAPAIGVLCRLVVAGEDDTGSAVLEQTTVQITVTQ